MVISCQVNMHVNGIQQAIRMWPHRSNPCDQANASVAVSPIESDSHLASAGNGSVMPAHQIHASSVATPQDTNPWATYLMIFIQQTALRQN